ncbi:hypothetical protein ARMSODRAFT_980690 [Armillaria solidipes]|uniref:Restriction endonuclease domain-containing protein n=1 Tax=Armillaria solidipes TaxID=1076256 RepID=A0A2H3B0H2_9AGAR|nr:hypothetical protein ARMSODRAFT_980690 [Armillaria solidipes]
MTSVIGGDTYYRGSTRSFTSYASPHPEAMQRASAAKDQAEVANAMKKNLTVSSKIVENCPPSPVPEVPEDVKVLLQDLDDSPAVVDDGPWITGMKLQKPTGAVRWEFLGNKIIVTIPTPSHEAISTCVQAALNRIDFGEPWYIEYGSDIPLLEGHRKAPDIQVYDHGYNHPSWPTLPDEYTLPHLVFEIAYSETKGKLMKDILRLILELEGTVLSLDGKKELKALEINVFHLSDKGTMSVQDAKDFTIGEIYAFMNDQWTLIEGDRDVTKNADTFRLVGKEEEGMRPYYECSLIAPWMINEADHSKKKDITISADYLKRIPDGNSAVISAEKLWTQLKKRHAAKGVWDAMG